MTDNRVETVGNFPDDVTAAFRIAYDVAVRRCDLCPRCGKAPVSKVLLIRGPVKGALDMLLAVCDACYDERQPPR